MPGGAARCRVPCGAEARSTGGDRAAVATEEERAALLHGDVAWLYEQGAHPFLLAYLTRWELFGLTVQLYSERIRTAREPGITE